MATRLRVAQASATAIGENSELSQAGILGRSDRLRLSTLTGYLPATGTLPAIGFDKVGAGEFLMEIKR